METKPGTDRLIDTYLSMDHFERDRAYRHALADGDRGRARIAAFTPIPSNWLERHRAIWLSRRKQLDIELTTTREPAINAHVYGNAKGPR